MNGRARVTAFLRSREGSAFIVLLLFAAALAVGTGDGFYGNGIRAFTRSTQSETVTALQLVDAFVDEYSGLRGAFGAADAPVPSTFRAHAIERFDKARIGQQVLRLRLVGRAGHAIATPPSDPAMAQTIERFVGQPSPKPVFTFLKANGHTIFRTVYPSLAREESCVACHNKLQPQEHWRRNDVLGAFSIDVPAQPYLDGLLIETIAIGTVLFVVVGGIGLWISLIHHRRILDQQAAQMRLEASEERFRDFAEACSDWFWEQDENLRISFVSENEVSKRLGSTPANQLGKSRREVVTLGVTDAQWQAHEAEQRARRPFQKFRFQRIDANGGLRHVELNGKPIFDAAGRFRGYRGTAKDITSEIATELELTRRVAERTAELHRVQEELLRKERLSTLGQFTATVAHELRNPLSAIRNTAFSISEAVAARGLSLDRPIARLERSITRCDRLIGDLLEYTRARELKLQTTPLSRWLGEVLDEQQLPDAVALTRDFDGARFVARFDPDYLRRVVINLIDNAIHALAELPESHGSKLLTVRTRATDAGMVITIEDNGPGIAPDVLPKVFEPLFSTKSFGTGLGLPTVKQIVEQHGGTIEIASEFGRGTQVIVTLPAAPADAATELAA